MATALKERDPIAELGIKLISADNHINEPRDLFITRFPQHLKDKAPRVVEGADGGEGWTIDGVPPKRTYGLEAMAGFDKKDYRRNPPKWDDDGLAAVNKYVLPTREHHPFQVLVLDYARAEQTELIQAGADRAATFGFLHAAAPVSLDEVYPVKMTGRADEKFTKPQVAGADATRERK